MNLFKKIIILCITISIAYTGYAQTDIYKISNNNLYYKKTSSTHLQVALNTSEVTSLQIKPIDSCFKPIAGHGYTVAKVINNEYLKVGKTFQI